MGWETPNKLSPKQRLIDRIYAELPRIECKGLCHEACGPIAMSRLEDRRILHQLGRTPDYGFNVDLTCDLLDPLSRRCTVYEMRPLICRLFGLINIPTMRCPFGCVPDRWLTDEESRELINRVNRIGV